MVRIVLAFTAAVLLSFAPGAPAQEDGVISIPYTQYTLDNGLTLIVHVDRKAPIVAVNVWYDVGSADEPEGKTGFAHLFEHLMFNGSENFNDDYFKALDRLGATGTNGTTNFDRTNYFQVVPTWPSTPCCGWNRTAWDTCWAPSARSGSTSSGAWCRTKSARVKTSPTARRS